jgi:hypothetical protein
MTGPTWASRLAGAIKLDLEEIALPGEVQVHSITAISSEEVEVVYSLLPDSALRGFRISADIARSAPERIRVSSIEELAFDIVTTGILEPRPPSDFLPVDPDGVRWLSIPGWLQEIT